MKLIDLLKVMHKDVFLILEITVCDMTFKTRHAAGFYADNKSGLNERSIEKVYQTDEGLCIRLGDH